MRINSGIYKGRKLFPPRNLPVRPTTDKAKESLFNIINNEFYFEDLTVLDLFSGTGNISYEFASRGCGLIMAVDSDFRCIRFINETTALLNAPIRPVRANAFTFMDKINIKFDIIFADPPYNLTRITEIPDMVFNNNLLNSEGLLVVEHSSETDFSKHPFYNETRVYSKVNFSFFRK